MLSQFSASAIDHQPHMSHFYCLGGNVHLDDSRSYLLDQELASSK
jgi:hypothetical protein